MNKHRKTPEFDKPAVPITPMLDLTFQLLFFFITLFDPNSGGHKIEGQMDLMLPAAEKKGQAADPAKVEPAPSDIDPEPDIPSDLTVIVSTQLDGSSNGTIASLSVEDRAGKAQVEYDVRLTELTKYLKEQRAKSEHSNIRVQGDSKVHWEAMIQVMDACRKAGFENVGFMQPPDFNLANP